MRVLVILHEKGEDLGRLEPVLTDAGAVITHVRMYRNEHLPLFHYGYDAIVTMGGPMNVYDKEHEWFFSQEVLLLRRAIESDVPVMGICLGSQMIARALGARVMKAPVKEIGFFPLELTAAGKGDDLFRGVPEKFNVLQWHGDTFDLPEGSQLLVTGNRVPHQGYRFRRAFGLQFHLEANLAILEDWIGDDESLRTLLDQYPVYDIELERTVRAVGENFAFLVQARGK